MLNLATLDGVLSSLFFSITLGLIGTLAGYFWCRSKGSK
jgi:hypothetical protein